jgi:hypothetical protein
MGAIRPTSDAGHRTTEHRRTIMDTRIDTAETTRVHEEEHPVRVRPPRRKGFHDQPRGERKGTRRQQVRAAVHARV